MLCCLLLFQHCAHMRFQATEFTRLTAVVLVVSVRRKLWVQWTARDAWPLLLLTGIKLYLCSCTISLPYIYIYFNIFLEAKTHAFLTLGIGCKWVVTFMLLSLHHETNRRYALGSNRSGHCSEMEPFYPAEDWTQEFFQSFAQMMLCVNRYGQVNNAL
jgi:hypothetical protein